MTTQQRSTIVGVFENRSRANEAVEELKKAGFRDDQIGVVGRYDDTVTGEVVTSEGDTMWEEGAVTGALTGAGLGALVGLGILAGVVPAIGPVIAGGTLSMMLANAAGGAAIAGIAGALIGAGMPEEEAEYYEGEVRSGKTMVTVKPEGRAAEAQAVLYRFGAYDMHSGSSTETAATRSAAMSGTGATGAVRTGEGETIRVHEEQLHATKTPVRTGEVRVHKEVVTEHKTIDVPVEREEVVIERHPASGSVSEGTIGEGEEIRIPVREEQVNVTKQTVAKEDVSVGKRVVTETRHVGGEVRREEVRVEQEGDVHIKGAKPRDAGNR